MTGSNVRSALARRVHAMFRLSCLLGLAGTSVGAAPPMNRPVEVMASRRPLAFEANRGQLDARVQFVARGAAFTVFLTSSEAVLTLGDRRAGRSVLSVRPVGAKAATWVVGGGALPGTVTWFPDGQLASAVSAPTYRHVRYVDVYPGIDLVYHSRARTLEYDFVVARGADPDQIGLAIDGAERVEVDGEGTLVVHAVAGELRQPPPVAYQRIGGVRRPVAADYASTPRAGSGCGSARTTGRAGSSSIPSSPTRRTSAAPATRRR